MSGLVCATTSAKNSYREHSASSQIISMPKSMFLSDSRFESSGSTIARRRTFVIEDRLNGLTFQCWTVKSAGRWGIAPYGGSGVVAFSPRGALGDHGSNGLSSLIRHNRRDQ